MVMVDPVADAQAERDALLAEVAEAGEQARAWRERRNALVIAAAARNISYRRIAEYVGLSDVAVGRIVRTHRAHP
ncbi:hypothetical protein GCM10029964_014730 [Kibdelosporangium lantanae]